MERIAGEYNIEYKFYNALNYDQTVKETAAGKFDVTIGSISVTAKRQEWIDYTRPFFMGQFGILIRDEKLDFLSTLIEVFGDLLIIVGFFGMFVIVAFSSILLYFERRKTKVMSGNIKKAFGMSVWITMTCF